MLKRPQFVLLAAIVLFFVFLAAGWFLLVGPRKAEIDNRQKDIDAAQQKIDAGKITYQQLVSIKNRSAWYEAKLASLQAMIPEEPELPALIRNIQAAADPGSGAGLPWLSFSPSEIAADASGTGYSTYTFTMSVGGFYDEVVDLVYRLESFSRAVVITDISIIPVTTLLQREYDENLGVVQADLTARTFTFYGVTAPPAPPVETESEE